ncbi:TPM domain-containing protein [Xanthobacter sp. ZOL 2024]
MMARGSAPRRRVWRGARWSVGFGASLLALLGALTLAWALTFPDLSGRVVDAAHVLDPSTRAELDGLLAAQEAKASDQFVVATVPSLEGQSIEEYANALFRAWRLGQAKANNGVLLLVAPQERKVRIEVGYGLEGILTDAVASAIIRNAIIPAFKAGDMSAGILKGAQAILEILNLDPEEARARAREAETPGMTAEDWEDLIFLVLMLAFWAYVIWRVTRGGGSGGGRAGRRRRAGGVAAGPITTWDWSRSSGGWSGGSGGWSGGGGSSGGGGASGSW